MAEQWERAEIKYRLMEDHYSGAYSGPGYGASLQFIARAWNEKGQYRVGQSIRLPIALPPGASRVPEEDNAQHHALFQELVETLRREGWEQLTEKGEQWWQLRFRRPFRPQIGLWTRLRLWAQKTSGRG